jgi:hypothetical protein
VTATDAMPPRHPRSLVCAHRLARPSSTVRPSPGSHLVGDPVVAWWGTDLVEGYRGHWRELPLRFVEDPHAATGEAAGHVEEAMSHTPTRPPHRNRR